MILCLLIQIYLLLVFARIVMSWFAPTPGTTYAQIYTAVWNVTEPVLGPLRRVLPSPRIGMMALDLSPIVVLLLGQLVLGQVCGG